VIGDNEFEQLRDELNPDNVAFELDTSLSAVTDVQKAIKDKPSESTVTEAVCCLSNLICLCLCLCVYISLCLCVSMSLFVSTFLCASVSLCFWDGLKGELGKRRNNESQNAEVRG
jgi:hypothetical protein